MSPSSRLRTVSGHVLPVHRLDKIDLLVSALLSDWIYHANDHVSPSDPHAEVLHFSPADEKCTAFAIVGRASGRARSIFIVFRGTKDILDILTDVNVRPRITKTRFGDINVHSGFEALAENALRIIDEKLSAMVDSPWANARLLLCGHSLGGALAMVSAMKSERQSMVVTFGAPNVAFNLPQASRQKAHREFEMSAQSFVHHEDPVPQMLGPHAPHVLRSLVPRVDLKVFSALLPDSHHIPRQVDKLVHLASSYSSFLPDSHHIPVNVPLSEEQANTGMKQFKVDAHYMADVYLGGVVASLMQMPEWPFRALFRRIDATCDQIRSLSSDPWFDVYGRKAYWSAVVRQHIATELKAFESHMSKLRGDDDPVDPLHRIMTQLKDLRFFVQDGFPDYRHLPSSLCADSLQHFFMEVDRCLTAILHSLHASQAIPNNELALAVLCMNESISVSMLSTPDISNMRSFVDGYEASALPQLEADTKGSDEEKSKKNGVAILSVRASWAFKKHLEVSLEHPCGLEHTLHSGNLVCKSCGAKWQQLGHDVEAVWQELVGREPPPGRYTIRARLLGGSAVDCSLRLGWGDREYPIGTRSISVSRGSARVFSFEWPLADPETSFLGPPTNPVAPCRTPWTNIRKTGWCQVCSQIVESDAQGWQCKAGGHHLCIQCARYT